MICEMLLLEELESLGAKGLMRKVRTLTDPRGTRASWQGREIILFCGNDYLGLSQNSRLKEAARTSLERYGVGAGAARLISGTTELHTELEKEIARFKGKERALIFGAGYLANLGILGALAHKGDLIVMDKLCHASLIDGGRLSGAEVRIFPHKNYERCEDVLKKSTGYRRKILVSDTVFSMDGDLADLARLIRLKEAHDCLLVVDDAHGTGVFGAEGRGATEGFEEGIDCITGTFSKAFGVFGGFVAASETLIEYLINLSRPFLFATAPPPAFCAASLEAIRIIEKDFSFHNRLWDHVDQVRKFLAEKNRLPGIRSPIFPLLIGDETEAVRISEALLAKGILIPAIRYPTVPRGKARLRLTVSAAHTPEDLEKLFEALSEVLDRHCEAAFPVKPKQSR